LETEDSLRSAGTSTAARNGPSFFGAVATQKSVKAEFDGRRWRLVTASPVLGELAATRFRDFWKD
jgi:hypothetical protein